LISWIISRIEKGKRKYREWSEDRKRERAKEKRGIEEIQSEKLE